MILRKISTIPLLIAMMMVAVASFTPHHHHDTMICVVKEICSMDGRCDDEHTHHSDTNHEDDESHCVAHEQYSFTDNIHIDRPLPSTIINPAVAATAELSALRESVAAMGCSPDDTEIVIPSPPPLSSSASNAPPFSDRD